MCWHCGYISKMDYSSPLTELESLHSHPATPEPAINPQDLPASPPAMVSSPASPVPSHHEEQPAHHEPEVTIEDIHAALDKVEDDLRALAPDFFLARDNGEHPPSPVWNPLANPPPPPPTPTNIPYIPVNLPVALVTVKQEGDDIVVETADFNIKQDVKPVLEPVVEEEMEAVEVNNLFVEEEDISVEQWGSQQAEICPPEQLFRHVDHAVEAAPWNESFHTFNRPENPAHLRKFSHDRVIDYVKDRISEISHTIRHELSPEDFWMEQARSFRSLNLYLLQYTEELKHAVDTLQK